MSLIATADRSRVAAVSGRVHGGYHVLKINGHSRTLGTQHAIPARCFESCPFRAGEHTWLIRYYPMGSVPANADFIAIFLVLVDTAAGEEGVLAQVTFSLLDQDQKPVPSYTFVSTAAYNFSQLGSNIGCPKFMKREELERSGLVKDDCFAIRVDIHLVVSREESTVLRPSSSDMHQHFGDLLSSNKGNDVEFHVGGETFAAHRLVLRARSPVFKAQLLAPSKAVVEVDDMEPRVFKALLTFIYTDTWPKMVMEQDDDEEKFAMVRGLLVAADRYGLQRLKLMCENWLGNRIDNASVSTILALSEKHNCAHLKEACFDFISSLTVVFAINDETGGFDHLSQSYPRIAKELIVNAINRDKEKAKHAACWWDYGNDQASSVVKKATQVAHATNSTATSSLLYLFSGFVISIIINSYIGV